MLHSIFLTILFYLITSLASSTPTRFPPKGNGFIAPLIPPISPHSPFYPQILAANNIPATLTNVTLDRTHYEKWVETKRNMSQNDYSIVTYNKNAFYYVVGLFLGNPMQVVYGIFDTGSDLVWVQCNNLAGKNKFPYFNQTRSNKYKVIDCRNKKQCQTNYTKDVRCSTIRGDNSCRYNIEYVDGDNSQGVMSSDVITMKPNMSVVPYFVFGCSNDNPERTPGMIGAGNSIYSMPRQLYPNDPKFSYCISGLSSAINFVRFGMDAKLLGGKVKIFRHGLEPFYFMDVIGMRVNAVNIKADPSVFQLSRDGQTGFMIDSGYEYTSLSKVAFDALKDTLYEILGTPTKVSDFEICYQFGTGWLSKPRPVIGIMFRGWLFELDESNVWRKMGYTKFECLLVDRTPGNKLSVLGAQQLFGVNVGHDIKNNLLYLQPMKCPTAY